MGGAGIGIAVVIVILMPVFFQVILLAGKERERHEAVIKRLMDLDDRLKKIERSLSDS